MQERDGSNLVTREYVWGQNMGGGIGGLLNMRQGGSDYAYLYDGKGNVTALLNPSQAVAGAYAYDPFGRVMKKAGTMDQPYMFSTKEYDPETGLSYYGFRYYNASIGKWITRDPLGEAGGVNLYGFVGNMPMNAIDPYGKSWWTIPFEVVGEILGFPSGTAAANECTLKYAKSDWKDETKKRCVYQCFDKKGKEESYEVISTVEKCVACDQQIPYIPFH